jgi:hypothetical protein
VQVARLQDERDDAFRDREAALAEREMAVGQVSIMVVVDLSPPRGSSLRTMLLLLLLLLHTTNCCKACKAVAHPHICFHTYAFGQ